jgi:hypothetical protein
MNGIIIKIDICRYPVGYNLALCSTMLLRFWLLGVVYGITKNHGAVFFLYPAGNIGNYDGFIQVVRLHGFIVLIFLEVPVLFRIL